MFLFVALVSVLVPLSLCVVPSLARLTVFPLLTGLINKFASAYLKPCLKVEFAFGARDDDSSRADAPKGLTISLFFVQLADAFLQTLAFAKQGLAPAALERVAIDKITLFVSTTWQVVVHIDAVAVDVAVIDPNAPEHALTLDDAVAMKAVDATNWLYRIVQEKQKDDAQAALDATAKPHAFAFKDRVVQYILAQVDVVITNVCVHATAKQTTGDNPSHATRVAVECRALELTTRVQHEDAAKGLELVLTDNDIRIVHKVRMTEFVVSTLQIDTTAIAPAFSSTVEVAPRKPGGPSSETATPLLVLPELELTLDVPPIARVLLLVPNIAPLPLPKRSARVQLVINGTNRIAVAYESLARILQDVYVPVLDHQTLVKSIRLQEADRAATKTLSDADKAFYVDNFTKYDKDAAIAKQVRAIEATASLDDIVKLQSRALGLVAHFRAAQTDLSLADVVIVTAEVNAKPANLPFGTIQVALRLESLSCGFVEADAQVAELVFSSFGVNVALFAAPDGVEKKTQDVDVQLEHVLFVVNHASTASGPVSSPASKLVFVDFSNVVVQDEQLTKPQVVTAHVVAFESGKQVIAAGLNHLQIVAAADALEFFLMSVDRLGTTATQALASAHPAFEAIVSVDAALQAERPVEHADSRSPTTPQTAAADETVSMAPFSLLGGKDLDLTLAIDDCHVVLTPAKTFAKAFYSDIDVASDAQQQHSAAVINCRVDLPLSVDVHVTSSKTHEAIAVTATNVGLLARYIDNSDATEALLVPTNFALQFTLDQDANDKQLCYEHVAMQVPDFCFAFSDLSLALIASCGQALANMQTTTPEQAQRKRTSLQQQTEMRRQAELDVVLLRMRRLFEDIDANQNGQIELNELLLLLRRVKVGDSLLESELEYFVRVLFNEIDTDANGFVDFDELRAFLRDDLLLAGDTDVDAAAEREPNSAVGASNSLSGFLNLRGGEYRSTEVLERLSDARINSVDQFKEFVATKANVEARFWDLAEAEARITKGSLHGQAPLDVQKKLVRLLQHYDAAQVCWELLVAPSVEAAAADDAKHHASPASTPTTAKAISPTAALKSTTWLVQPFTYCGGVSEYQSAARVIAMRKRDGIFSAALSETQQLVQIAENTTAAKKALQFSTDLQLGNLRFVLTDAELPVRYCRGDLNISNVTMSVELAASDIDASGPVDWLALATSGSAQWTALFGVHLSASCFSELGDAMESVIEPWELAAGLNAVQGENGFSVLVEAAKRFQINVTPGLLTMYKTLMDVLDGEAEQTALQQHQEAVTSALTKRKAEGSDCLIQNSTGVDVSLTIDNETVRIAANANAYIARQSLVDGAVTLGSLTVAQFGATQASVALPAFGSVNVAVVSAADDVVSTPSPSATMPRSTLFVSAFCRLEDPMKQRIVLKSNLYFCNHSAQTYDVKYLALGSSGPDGHAAVTSPVFTLRPNERMALPVRLLMGTTELYARPENAEQWIVHATLNNDVLTSPAAVAELNDFAASREVAKQQRRGGTIVFSDTDDDSNAKVLKQLAPNVLVRRWHLRTHFEWELALLPPFVVRNSLPYTIEYRFVEYKVQTNAGGASASSAAKTEFLRLDKVLRDEEPAQAKDNVLTGAVDAGHDTEIAGVSCLAPGYISIRIIAKATATTPAKSSPWSKAMLMAIHAPVEQFSIARELVRLAGGAEFSVDRLSLPGLPRVVRFFSPYWIMNSTTFDFALASTAPNAKASAFTPLEIPTDFHFPILETLPFNRLSIKPTAPRTNGKRPAAWESLGVIADAALAASPITDDIVARAAWSEPINTSTINTVGELVCGPSVFAVKVEGLFGMFEQGVGLTLSPRFFVQNFTNEPLYIQSFGANESLDVEKVTDQFRKRSAVDVTAFSVELANAQTTPLYHFAPLKRTDDLHKCHKYVSVSFTRDWTPSANADDAAAKDSKWSFAIPIQSAGDLYVQMYSPTRKRDIICQASVQVIDMYVYVILTDVSSAPPYRIENYTPFTIDCAQLGESSLFHRADKETTLTIKPGEWHAFAWYNPLSKDRDVEIRVSHRDAPHAKTKKYDIDYVGYHDSLTVETVGTSGSGDHDKIKYELVVQVVVDGSTRVLKFVEHDLEVTRLENQNAAAIESEFAQRKMLFASSFDVRFAGFGLSLLDQFPQEVFFASLDVLTIAKPPATLAWTFSVFNLQLDDMLQRAKFPVILNPIDAGYSDKSVGKAPKPLLRLVLDADLAAKVGTYKLFEFDLSSVSIKLDIDYVVNLVKLLEPYLVSDSTVAIRSAATLDATLDRRVPVVAADARSALAHTDLVYFDVLRIHAIELELEYSITRNDIVSSTGGANGRSVVFGLLSQVIGLVGSNLSGSPTLSFNEIVIMRCFSTKTRLQNQLVQNYIRQGVLQAYRLVGSADIIGNPIGLVEDLGSGVMQFLKITKGEVLGDAQTRGEGVKVLGKTVVGAGASTIAKITGSLDRFVGEFADEDEGAYDAGNRNSENDKDASTTGIAPLDGGIQFAKDFGKGLSGIFTKPVQGAMKGGVTGLVTGTVSGIAGPGVVILKRLTSTTHSLALGVQSTVVDRSVFGGRRRQPKLIVDGRLIAEFDEAHYKPTRLQLEVLSASGLLSDSSCDPLCVVRIDDKVVLKTRVLYNTLNPVWQEKTQLELTGKERELQFVVKDSYGGAIDKTIGKCVLSMAQLRDDFKPPEHASNLAEWVKTGVKPDDTKTNKSHQVSEKEYDLQTAKTSHRGSSLMSLGGGGGTANTKATAAVHEYQVIVTIVSIEELQTTSASGGGMLGLGNLVSSTPNVSPYVSIHVGSSVSRTNTAKITFVPSGSDKKTKATFIGAATWNETFTFPYVVPADAKAAASPLTVTFSLKDKSVLHDERLARATKTLDLAAAVRAVHPTVEKLKWTAKGDDTGDVIGYLNVKIDVVSANVQSPTANASVTKKKDEDDDKDDKEDDEVKAAVPTTKAPPLGSVKAGKIRVACAFV